MTDTRIRLRGIDLDLHNRRGPIDRKMFPYSVEHAAFVLVGVEHHYFPDDARRAERWGLFERRGGPEVYARLVEATATNQIESFTIEGLLDWARSEPSVYAAMPSWVEEHLVAFIEDGDSTAITSEIVAAINELSGKRGKKSAYHRGRVLNVARNLDEQEIAEMRVGEFMKSAQYLEAVQGIKYDPKTVKNWVRGLPFDRRPGRPKKKK